MNNNQLTYEIVSFYPENFFSKTVNEQFIQLVMASAIKKYKWVKGNADKFEPDYFVDGIPFEFTIASNKKRKNNFVQLIKERKYSSDNVEKDVFTFVEERIRIKSEKKYTTPNVYLCVLCLIDMFNWVSDEYGSFTHIITDYPRKQFFNRIKEDYITTRKFENIFIIVPDLCGKWWVFDVALDKKVAVCLTRAQLQSEKYPFVLEKSEYDKLFSEKIHKEKNGRNDE